MISLPDPPLASGQLTLRPWRIDDASALVEAWADEEIQRWTGVPDARDLDAAEHWIAGDAERRRRDLSLDLVVQRDQRVAGEVGLSAWSKERGTIEIGWWTVPRYRRRGVATVAAGLVVEWASSHLGVAVMATCDPANPASIAVAESAGAIVQLRNLGSSEGG